MVPLPSLCRSYLNNLHKSSIANGETEKESSDFGSVTRKISMYIIDIGFIRSTLFLI